MKNIVFLFLFTAGASHAQQDLNLDVCDTFPKNFYANNYSRISITNSMGYCISPVKKLDDRIQNFQQLKSLTYLHYPYSKYPNTQHVILPDEVKTLTELTELNTNVPNAAIFSMTNLKRLTLTIRDSSFAALLNEYDFGQLTELEFLHLSCNPALLKGIEIRGLEKLEKLKVVHLNGPDQQLLGEVTANPNIEELSITHASGLDVDFSKMNKLKALGITRCDLQKVPESIYALSKLESLNLSQNQITAISPAIGDLNALKSLDLSRNIIANLPEELTRCHELTDLSLSSNRNLNQLPLQIGELTNLQHLGVSDCHLQTLPSSLSQCHQLVTLNASNNLLSTLDMTFNQMHLLEKVILQKNQLTALPASLFSCPNITHLDLARNQLTKLANSIGNMESLMYLDIYENKLTALPKDIGKLSKLERLSAYQNHLTELPQSIVELKQIRELYVGDNMISSFPADFKQLNSIITLEIQHNPITAFPQFIYQLRNLDRVWISPKQAELTGYRPSEKNPYIIITD